MWKCQVITQWIDQAGAKVPDLTRLLVAGDSLMDVSGEAAPVDTPHVTPMIVEVWCKPETLQAIEADPDYGADAILWTEEVDDGSV